jgi:hypothetical protein
VRRWAFGGSRSAPFRLTGTGSSAVAGLGIVTPGDVLAYRALWNQYVLDSVGSAQYCATSLNNVAGGSQGAQDATTAANLQGQATALDTQATAILTQWNLYANQTDDFIVLQGAQILQTFQQTVVNAGNLRAQMTSSTVTCSLEYIASNGQLTIAVPGPDPSLQAQVIARIEGLGILGSGILQILLGTASNALQAGGSATQWVAKTAGNLVETVLSPWWWALAGVVGVSAVGIIYAPEIKGALSAKRAARV